MSSKKCMIHQLDEPALNWFDGHILGNGDIGAVVWGHSGQVCIGFSKHDVNYLRHSEHGTRWETNYPELKRRAMAGEREHLKFDTLKNIGGATAKTDFQISCGQLTLELLRGAPVVGYQQSLSMEDAVCTVKSIPSEMAKRQWGVYNAPLTVDCFVHAESNVAIIKIDSETVHNVLWKFDHSVNSVLPQAPEYRVTDDNIGVAVHELPENQDYALVIGTDKKDCEFKNYDSCMQGRLELGGENGPVRIVIAMASIHDTPEGRKVEDQALEILKQALADDAEKLEKEHFEWWKKFWEASAINYEDEYIAQMWYMGVYAMASSTRPDKTPPNLQGIWNQYDIPPWHADFHFNTNVQECQWLPCISNHPELQEALVNKLTGDWLEQMRSYAKECFESPGLAVPLCTDWLGRAIGGVHLGLEMSLTAWIAQHLWWQWLYTRDKKVLQQIYPFLKDACEFYLSAILTKRDDGLFHIELSHSPEQIGDYDNGEKYIVYGSDPTIDLVFIRILFKAFTEASEILDEADGDFVKKCREVVEHLPANPVEDGVLIDETVGFFHTGDAPGRFPVSHRHPSRLVGIYPGEEIGLHSEPETLELGRRSFQDFRAHGDHGFTGWSIGWQTAIAARLGLAAEAEDCLYKLKEYFLLDGLLTSHNRLKDGFGAEGGALFQIESLFGAVAGINEMLLQSPGGIIRVFPAVPEERSASFQNLRAVGAVLVSAEKVGRQINLVELKPLFDTEIKLANPWPGESVLLVDKDGETVVQGDVLTWQAKAGVTYRLSKNN